MPRRRNTVYSDITELIGKTPLLKLCAYAKKRGLKAKIYAKLESFNPAGSVKDRTVLSMLSEAEASGRLKGGETLVAATSGNFGIALAAIGGVKGYKAVLTMPANMSAERRSLLKAYGAEVVLTEAEGGMAGAAQRAEELAAERGGVILNQFESCANPAAHYRSTGREIWEDTDGKVDVFVAGAGTGGTLSGAGAFLKEKNPEIRVVAVEPADSPVLSKGAAGPHKIQGIGAGFVPQVLDRKIFGEVIAVESRDAYSAVKELAETEGIFAGISSGAALWAAAELAASEENAGKNIVAIFPDGGERYLSAL